MGSEPTQPLRPAAPWWRHAEVLVIVAVVAATYGLRLAALPVAGEESRWATAAREMMATGDFIVPRQQGVIFPERPPLGSWTMAAVGYLRGEVDLVAIRLPSVLATVAMAVVIYAYCQLWMSRGASLIAALIYPTFGLVLQIGRLGESESLFTLFVASSLFAWHAGYLRGAKTWAWCAGYSLAALGSLVKGPQAPVYFIAITSVFLATERDWRWLFSRAHAAGIALFVAIVGAWFVPFALREPEWIRAIWLGLAEDRFTLRGALRHMLSYPPETFGCLLPWSPLLIAYLTPSIRRTIAGERPEMKFAVVALAVAYPSVWLAAGARGRYFMPLYPCAAVLVALVLEYCTRHATQIAAQRVWRHYARGLAIAVTVAGVAVATTSRIRGLEQVAQPLAFMWLWLPAVAMTAALLFWSSAAIRTRPQAIIAAVAGFLAIAHLGPYTNARIRSANDLDPALARIKRQLGAGELVSLGRVDHRFAYSFDEPIPLVPWPETAHDVPDDLEYFCFDRRPGDTAQSRATSDGRLSTTTKGTLPFDWEPVAEVPCDPRQSETHSRTVVIGRVRRDVPVARRPVSEAGASPTVLR